MRKDAACLAALCAALLFAPAARAGTYTVVACQVTGGAGINQSWSVEPYSSSGREPADISNYTIPAAPTTCATTTGITLGSSPVAGKSVKASDGAAFVFHAPAGNLVSAIALYRYGQARLSSSGASTYWEAIARAGSTAGGPALGTTAGTDYCLGNSAAWPSYCQLGASAYPNGLVQYSSIQQPVVAIG